MIKIYLAIPYSHSNSKIREWRFNKANEKAAEILKQGYIVYSPISHSHPIHLTGKLPSGWKFWEQHDTTFIKWCDELWVYKLPGWSQSIGVKAEIKIAQKLRIPIKFIEMEASNG